MKARIIIGLAMAFAVATPVSAEDAPFGLPGDVPLAGYQLPADTPQAQLPVVQVEQDVETLAFIQTYLGHGSQFGPEH